MPKLVQWDELPKWIQANIKSQQQPYLDFFEAKWAEFGQEAIGFSMGLDMEKRALPQMVVDMIDVATPGHYSKIRLADGTRVLGLATVLGPLALYEIDHATEVPIDEKGSKGIVMLKNFKLHAAEIFWKANLLELDQKGGANLITFMYAFGLSDPSVPVEKRNSGNMAVRMQMVADAYVARVTRPIVSPSDKA
jgi:hypothetical protein